MSWLQNFSPEGDVLAEEGWNIKSEVIVAICTEFSETLFETVVNSSWRKSRIFRVNPDRQVDTVFFQHKENCSCLLMRARCLPQSSPFKSSSPGMRPTWNCLDVCVGTVNLGSQRCWFTNSFTKLRYHGILKRDVQRLSSELLWWWQYMLQTQVKVWRCTRSVSRASLKYYEKDVGVESKTSTLQMISMWNWDWCVQMKRTWTSKRKGQESWTGTWRRTRKNWVSCQYECFHWIGFRWIVYAYEKQKLREDCDTPSGYDAT